MSSIIIRALLCLLIERANKKQSAMQSAEEQSTKKISPKEQALIVDLIPHKAKRIGQLKQDLQKKQEQIALKGNESKPINA